MKSNKILLLTLLAFFAFTGISLAQSADSATVVSVETFEKMSKKKRKTVILDVRTPQEVAEGHLAGAKNIDVQDELFQQNIEQLDKNKTYLLYCRSGKRTAVAGAKMKAAGFKKVYMLDGGITSWKEKGKPVTNDKN
jgi:rhodanese-related sulfurtransferase